MSDFKVVDWNKLSDSAKLNALHILHAGIKEKQNFLDFARDQIYNLSRGRFDEFVIKGFCLVEEIKEGNKTVLVPFATAIACVSSGHKTRNREVYISHFATAKNDSAKRFIKTHLRTPMEEVFTRVLTWGKRMGCEKITYSKPTERGRAFFKRLKQYGWIGERMKITGNHPSPKTFVVKSKK
jgi:hypothetical protein